MDDAKGWTIFGCTLVIGIVAIIISAQFYFRDVNKKIVEMTINGADPVAAAIALDNIYDDAAKSYFLSKAIETVKGE